MASSKYSPVTTQTIVLLWIFLQGQALATTFTSCKSRMNTYYTITSYCTNWLSTRCCYDNCCDKWDYSWNYKFSSCQSGIARYQTCRNAFSTSCCRRTYGSYSTCCSTTSWWQTTTSTTSTWWSTSRTTYSTNSNNGGVSLIGGIVGGIFAVIVTVIIVVVVSVICCGHRSAGRRGRVLGGVGNRNAVPMMAGAQPTTTTTVTHHPYPAQPQPGGYPNQYPQGPYPYPQGGPSYPQGPPQGGSAPYPPSTGVYAPPPSYDSALNMQMGSNMTELTPNPSESAVPSAPYPQGPVGGETPYPIQPAGMPPPRY